MTALNFHYLRYFWAVAHDGNLTRAAERLHISASAVSVQIQKLEDQLGHKLFERRGRQLVLTEAGSIALDHADAIFELSDELVGTLGESGDRARRVLRVGALATLSRNFQLGFLQPLIGREDVELVLRSGLIGDLLRELEAHRLDVILAHVAPMRDSGTAWVPHLIAQQPVSLVGRPSRIRKGRRLADILASESLLLPTIESSIRTGFDALTERLGIRVRVAAEIDDMAMLRLMARESHGLAVVPRIVVKDELEAGELAEIRRLPELFETFYAITPTRRFPNPLLRELMPEEAE